MKNKKLFERNWEYTIPKRLADNLRLSIRNEDCDKIKSAIIAIYKYINSRFDLIEDYQLEDWIEDVEVIDKTDQHWPSAIDCELNYLYDFCDEQRIWIPITDLAENKKYKKESLNYMEDDGYSRLRLRSKVYDALSDIAYEYEMNDTFVTQDDFKDACDWFIDKFYEDFRDSE